MTDSRPAEEQATPTGWTVGLSLTGAAVLFLVLRLLAVSKYDWRLAFSMAGTIGIDDVPRMVIGTLMADPRLVGVVLAVLLPATLIHQIGLGRLGWDSIGTMAALLIVALATVALVSTYHLWWVLALATAVGALLALPLLLWRRHPTARRFDWLVDHTSVLMLAAAFILAATVGVPWVSLERIETPTATIHGYVLENPPGFLKILTEDRREITIINTTEVQSRTEIPPE
ncbi:hypothetical protein H0264_10935 [Nocardia huaxiensis]|uniref:Uncharacterized protein n=1 Tax=Nocardia huaxiensis TaxID=2755382 RepID=A0A7D6VBX5_9NOCA|nr:hypothetical protein [Nocardia huaxiensis]QLY32692.1 hypothetical protein H0264_10935 [Nocardia huaxiensis]